MIFNLSKCNHSGLGAFSLGDIYAIMKAQLEDLGHRVMMDDAQIYAPPVVNVIVENFDDASLDMLRRVQSTGSRIVVVATEGVGRHGFAGYDERHNHGLRKQRYGEALKFAEAQWVLVPHELEWYARHHMNTTVVELGYSKRLESAVKIEPQYDFSIFGGMMPYRREMVMALRDKATVLAPLKGQNGAPNYLLPKHRDEMVQAAKFSLHLKQDHDWRVISASRCCTSLHLGRALISDRIDSHSPFQPVLYSVKSRETFIEEALALLPNWQVEYERQMGEFRKLDAEHCLGAAVRALDHTSAIAL